MGILWDVWVVVVVDVVVMWTVVVVVAVVLVDRWKVVVHMFCPSVPEDAAGGRVSTCSLGHPLAHGVEELFWL